jgi:cytochrome P450
LQANFPTFGDKNVSLEKFAKDISIDSLDYTQNDYLKYCLYESMRIEPPVPFSTSFMLTETLDIGKFKIRAGDMMF